MSDVVKIGPSDETLVHVAHSFQEEAPVFVMIRKGRTDAQTMTLRMTLAETRELVTRLADVCAEVERCGAVREQAPA